MVKYLLIVLIITFVVVGVLLTHYLDQKKCLPNRWLLGLSVFLIVLIPIMIIPTMPSFIKQILYGISALLTIVFFESTRLMLERGNYRGIVKPKERK